MKLDNSSSRPVFQQVADGIRQRIAAGVYAPGEAVPSIRAMATRLKVNPNTIKRAYEELQREGIVEFRPGLGLFVTPGSEKSAKGKTVHEVREHIAQAMARGLAAGLSKSEIDAAVAAAWKQVGGDW